jgi:hypothetical protein
MSRLSQAIKNKGLTRHASQRRSVGVIQSIDRISMAEKRCGSAELVGCEAGCVISVDTDFDGCGCPSNRTPIAWV